MGEALTAMIECGFMRWGLQEIEGGAQVDNLASLAVMQNCGMQPAGERMVFAEARGRAELCRFLRVGAVSACSDLAPERLHPIRRCTRTG